MIADKTLIEYISKCDNVLSSSDMSEAEMLIKEIVSVFQSDIKGITFGLNMYPPGVYEGMPRPDYIQDIRILRAKLKKELDAINTNTGIDLTQELIVACEKIARNTLNYKNSDEDGLNRAVRDLLCSALSRFGYSFEDQTQQGIGVSGTKPNELDILIKINGSPVAIYEGLIHSTEDYLVKHIEKAIGRYNPSGCRAVYVVEFSRNKNFSRVLITAKEVLRKFNGVDVEEMETDFLGVKLMQGSFNWEDQKGKFFYIGVNCIQ